MNPSRRTERSARTSLAVVCLFLLGPALSADEPKPSKTLVTGSQLFQVAFSPNGATLVSAGMVQAERFSELRLWDVATGKNTATFKVHAGNALSVGFSPDGKTLAAGGAVQGDGEGRKLSDPAGEIWLWDIAGGNKTATLKGHAGMVWSVVFSPDGKTLASSSQDGTVKLWDVATAKNTATFQANTGFFGSVAFSPDGKILASGGGPVKDRARLGVTGEIKLWDLATSRNVAIFQGHRGAGCFSNMFAVAFSLAFSPDGKTLVSGGSNTVELWDVATGKNLNSMQGLDGGMVWRIAFSSDGKTVAEVTERTKAQKEPKEPVELQLESQISLLEMPTGTNITTFKGHTGRTSSVAFSPDGKTLASCGEDGTIKLWKVAQLRGPKQPAGPDTLSGPQVMQRVAEVYAKCRSYRDSGSLTTKFVSADEKKVEGESDRPRTFTTAFVRPDRFRFEYKADRAEKPWRLIIWANGKDVREHWNLDSKKKKPASLDFALSVATGVTEFASTEITSLLMPKGRPGVKDATWKRLEDAALGDLKCLRIQERRPLVNLEDGTPFDLIRTYWVKKSSFLVHQAVIRMEFPKGERAVTTIKLSPAMDRKLLAKHLEDAVPD